MTFLELCRRVVEDSGVSASGPVSVTGQTGILQKIVTWVRKAAHDVELYHDDWLFMRGYKTLPLAQGQQIYPAEPNAEPIRSLSRITIGKQQVRIVSYDQWLDRIDEYSDPSKVGTPTAATLKPDQSLCFYPTPNEPLSVVVQYQKLPVALTTNTQIPSVPVQCQEAIVSRALVYYADYEEDAYRYQRALMEYDEWLRLMTEEQLPKMRVR